MESASARRPLVVICGPTASGKTGLAMEIAGKAGFEVISADSRQVYRSMDIGTAKATAEEMAAVPHHLVDDVDPDGEFSVADFARLAGELIPGIEGRGRRALVVGGTGLYIKSLTEGLLDTPAADEALRRRLHGEEEAGGEGTLHELLRHVDPPMAERLYPRDLIRIVRALEVFELSGERLSELQRRHAFAERPYRTLKFGLAPEREELYRRIDLRVEAMIEGGLVEEVRSLLDRGYAPQLKSMQAIGYRQIIDFLQGRVSLAEATASIQMESRRYAKRQLTWFRKDKSIIWVDSSRESARILELIDDFHEE